MIQTSAFLIAKRFIGLKEVPGVSSNPAIVAMLQLESSSITDESVSWCSAFANYVAWLLGLPRSSSLAARSWLNVGAPIAPGDAALENDIVVLKRGPDPQPGPEVINAPGHVGFFAGWFDPKQTRVLILGGNQKADGEVCVESFPAEWILGVRRLA